MKLTFNNNCSEIQPFLNFLIIESIFKEEFETIIKDDEWICSQNNGLWTSRIWDNWFSKTCSSLFMSFAMLI